MVYFEWLSIDPKLTTTQCPDRCNLELVAPTQFILITGSSNACWHCGPSVGRQQAICNSRPRARNSKTRAAPVSKSPKSLQRRNPLRLLSSNLHSYSAMHLVGPSFYGPESQTHKPKSNPRNLTRQASFTEPF